MKKTICFVLTLFLAAGNLFSQTITISGNFNPDPGSEETYTASFDYTLNPYTNLTWSVSGGTIVSQYANPTIPNDVYCIVAWNNSPGTGSISLYEDLQSVSDYKEVQIGTSQAVCEQADAGPDITICSAGATIGTPAITGYTYSWYPPAGLSNPAIAQPTVLPVQTTTNYTVTITSVNNLIDNGNFESGNVGFNTDYGLYPNGDGACGFSGTWGSEIVTTDPHSIGTQWCSIPDHSGAGDKMLFVDGSCAANRRVWYKTVSVNPGTTYYFSGWVIALSPYIRQPGVTGDLPLLRVTVNGVAILSNFTVNYTNCDGWIEFTGTWVANSSSATIAIYDDSYTRYSNDFVLDDLFLGDCPPSSDQVIVTFTGPVISPAGSTTVCSFWEGVSNPAILTSNMSGNLQWYKNGNSIPGATSQTYYAYAENGQGNIIKTYSYTVKDNGCESVPTIVHFVPYPFIFTATSTCRNSAIILYATDYGAGSSYLWSVPGGIISPNSTSRQISVTFPGSYTSSTFDVYLTVSNAYNCNGSNHQTFPFVNSCKTKYLVSREVNNTLEGIRLIPNPANSQVTIHYPKAIEKIEIYNGLGVLVKGFSGNRLNQMTINTMTFPNGVYFLKVFDTNESKFLKLLIRR